jgi:hypothetical protein
LDHKEFLGDGKGDPRRSLAAFLLETVGPQGSVVVYSGSFEGSCLAELARDFPDMAAGLRSIRARIWDLLIPFSRHAWQRPGCCGKLKSVTSG